MEIDANKGLPDLEPAQLKVHIESIAVSRQDVKDVLQPLNITKACSPEFINPGLLNERANTLAFLSSVVFKRSLEQGYVPSERTSSYKTRHVIAIFSSEFWWENNGTQY